MIKNNINKIKVAKDKPVVDDAEVDVEVESTEDVSPLQEYFNSLSDEEKNEMWEITKAHFAEGGYDNPEEEIDLNALVKEQPTEE